MYHDQDGHVQGGRCTFVSPAGTLNAGAHAQNRFPEEDLQWDPSEDRGPQMLKRYQEALPGGLKGGKKAVNTTETSEVLRGPGESPRQFQRGRAVRGISPSHPL